MAIENGSIEIITNTNANFGTPITPLFPLNISQVASQVKGRTGVTLGAKLPDIPDGAESVPQGLQGRWQGSSATSGAVEVRVWETAP